MTRSRTPKPFRDDPNRAFEVFLAPSGRVMVVMEVSPGTPNAFDRDRAWCESRASHLPVIFRALSGRQHSLGRCFRPRVFEFVTYMYWREAVEGEVSRSGWVEDLHRNPSKFLAPSPDYVRNSFEHYISAFVSPEEAQSIVVGN